MFQPTYSSGHYSFLFASDTIHPHRTSVDWEAFREKNITTTYYTPDVHLASFALPQKVIDALDNDKFDGEFLSLSA